jgi:hypothetical protein
MEVCSSSRDDKSYDSSFRVSFFEHAMRIEGGHSRADARGRREGAEGKELGARKMLDLVLPVVDGSCCPWTCAARVDERCSPMGRD